MLELRNISSISFVFVTWCCMPVRTLHTVFIRLCFAYVMLNKKNLAFCRYLHCVFGFAIFAETSVNFQNSTRFVTGSRIFAFKHCRQKLWTLIQIYSVYILLRNLKCLYLLFVLFVAVVALYMLLGSMMGAVSTSETSVNFWQSTWCNIPEDSRFSCLPAWEPEISPTCYLP
jgi:hypothetical protein